MIPIILKKIISIFIYSIIFRLKIITSWKFKLLIIITSWNWFNRKDFYFKLEMNVRFYIYNILLKIYKIYFKPINCSLILLLFIYMMYIILNILYFINCCYLIAFLKIIINFVLMYYLLLLNYYISNEFFKQFLQYFLFLHVLF